MTTTPNLGFAHLQENSADPEVPVNTALDGLDDASNKVRSWTISGNTTLTQAELASARTHKLAGSPASAFTFYVPAVSRRFGIINSSGRTATIRVVGNVGSTIVLDSGETAEIQSDGTNLTSMGGGAGGGGGGGGFSVGFFTGGQLPAPSGGAILLFDYEFVESVTFEADFMGSRSGSRVAANSSAVLDVHKNGVSVGAITFSGASQTGVFSTTVSATLSFAAGDTLSVYAPDPQDSTLASVRGTFKGTRA